MEREGDLHRYEYPLFVAMQGNYNTYALMGYVEARLSRDSFIFRLIQDKENG